MTPSFKKEIGARIKEERLKRNLRQKDCIKGLGDITIQMLSQWETGDATPGIDSLIKISKFYDVSIDYILTGQRVDKKTKYDTYKEIISDLLKMKYSGIFKFDKEDKSNSLMIYSFDKNLYNFAVDFEKIESMQGLLSKELLKNALIELFDKYNIEIQK